MTAAGRAIRATPVAVLGRTPERGERACGGLGGLNGGGVASARYADSLRAEPPGHSLLDSRRPGIVVLPVEDQDRRPAEGPEFCRAVRAGPEVPGHYDQARLGGAPHAPVQ